MLRAGFYEGSDKARTFSPLFRCNLEKLFPDFLKYTESQQMSIEYGVKQKLSDSTARSADQVLSNGELTDQFKETWDLILSGQWVKKTTPKTPLEKASAELAKAKADKAAMVDMATASGIDKTQALLLADKMFNSAIVILEKKVRELEKAKQE